MVIAINTRFLIKDQLEGIGRFTYEIVKDLVLKHPEVKFIFLFDRAYDQSFIFAENVHPIIVYPSARHPILYYIWFQWRLPQILKKYKVDLFLSPDGFVPLNAPCKTLPIIHDIAFEYFKDGVSVLTQKYYQHYFPKFAKVASRIITVSNFTKQALIDTYHVTPSKIVVAKNGVSNIFKPISQTEQKKIRAEFSQGHPYFISVGAIHPRKNMLGLLTAFEIFKANHPQESMKLLLVGRWGWSNNSVRFFLSRMKFKDDVIFAGKLNDQSLANCIAAANACIYPSFYEGFGLPVIESLACGTAVITTKNSVMEEIANGAATLIDPYDPEDISLAMSKFLNFETDEEVKTKRMEQAINYKWELTAAIVWKCIIKTLA